MWKTAIAAVAVMLVGLVAPTPAAAHCDSLDGPVVQAARQALDLGEVTPVLKWVRPDDEPEIREAFGRTLRVRSQGGEARDLADRWFFETLVRIHRAGEGAPYTGLKPAGHEPEPGIVAADRALESGEGGRLAEAAAETAARALRERYERVMALRDFAPDDVEAGRRYVHAYVDYVHFVEELHGLVSAGAGTHAATAEPHSH
jgi:hypothetical protein